MTAYEQLEKEFAQWTGLDDIVACSSGTAALHLAFEALQLPLGEVIMSDYNMIACPRAATLAGHTPVFVDCDDRLLIDVAAIKAAITSRTVAILTTHVYGRRCNMDEINRLATIHDLAVIEDLAEAHGIQPHKRSDAACWSFYKNKIIAGEEGGAVWLACKGAASIARELRCLGFTSDHDYIHRPRGCNYRLADCLASRILASLDRYAYNVDRRRIMEARYDELCPLEWKQPKRDAVWVYDIRCGSFADRQDDIVRHLRKNGIEARHGFKPMTSQPEYTIQGLGLTQSGRASREVIYLPVRPDISMSEIDKTFKLLREALA